MAKAKSKEFILKRWSAYCWLYYPRNKKGLHLSSFAYSLCYRYLSKFFGIKLEIGEKKRVRITIEEV